MTTHKVVPLDAVLNFVQAIATDAKGMRCEYAESRSGHLVQIPDFHALAAPAPFDVGAVEPTPERWKAAERAWHMALPCRFDIAFKTAQRALRQQPKKCDGNHGGPRCADPECWNDTPAEARKATPSASPDFLEFESYDDKLRRCGIPTPG